MSWFELTLIYLIFMVTAAIINKKTLLVKGIDELVFGAFVQLSAGLFSLAIALKEGFQYSLVSGSIKLFPLMLVTYLIAVSLFYTGLKRVDLSKVTILNSTGSVWSLILGVLLLNEGVTLSKIFGIVLIVVACTIPLINKNKVALGKFEKYILISALFSALGAVLDKKLNSYGSAISYIAISFTLYGFFMLLIFGKRTLLAFKFTFRKREFWRGVLINGFLYSLAFWALFSAYQRGGEVSRMFPITLSSSVIVPILGIVLLKEYDKWKLKLVAVTVLLAGLWFIKG